MPVNQNKGGKIPAKNLRGKRNRCELALFFSLIQSGEDPLDALSCRSFFAKEPLIIGFFCGQ